MFLFLLNQRVDILYEENKFNHLNVFLLVWPLIYKTDNHVHLLLFILEKKKMGRKELWRVVFETSLLSGGFEELSRDL